MNIYDVGDENLPNVYIDKILLTKEVLNVSKIQYTVVLSCLIKDHYGQKSWYGREELKGMKVKAALVFGSADGFNSLRNSLNSGQASLYNIRVSVAAAKDFTEFEIRTQDRGGNVNSIGSGYQKNFTFKILVDTIDTISINAYVAPFIDGIGFGIPMFDKYYGPMSSEIIITNNQVNKNSGYFYFSETLSDQSIANREFGGAVHSHDGNYMNGSEHRAELHYNLRYVPETNKKIIYSEINHTPTEAEPPDAPSTPAPNSGGPTSVGGYS